MLPDSSETYTYQQSNRMNRLAVRNVIYPLEMFVEVRAADLAVCAQRSELAAERVVR